MPTVSTLHLGGTFAETHVYNTVYMYICLYTLRLLCYLHSHGIDGPITDDKHNDLPFETCPGPAISLGVIIPPRRSSW